MVEAMSQPDSEGGCKAELAQYLREGEDANRRTLFDVDRLAGATKHSAVRVLPVLVLSLLMELLPLWFTKLMESMESDSELEELQDEPLPMESLLRSGLNRRYLNFILAFDKSRQV